MLMFAVMALGSSTLVTPRKRTFAGGAFLFPPDSRLVRILGWRRSLGDVFIRGFHPDRLTPFGMFLKWGLDGYISPSGKNLANLTYLQHGSQGSLGNGIVVLAKPF